MKNLIKKWWFILIVVVIYTIIVAGITYFVVINKNKNNTINTVNNYSTNQTTLEEKKDNKEETENSEQENEKIKQIALNKKIKEKDWEIVVKETGFKQDITPSNPDSYYSHYQVKDTSNTYFYIVIDAKNISSLALRADTVAKVKMKYDDKYEYDTFSTIEESGGGDTNITDIDPLTTRKVYYLVEVPKEISNNKEKSINAEITINNNMYNLKICMKLHKLQLLSLQKIKLFFSSFFLRGNL